MIGFGRDAGLLGAGLFMDAGKSVADGGNTGILRKSIENGAELSAGPPVIAIEKSDDFGAGFGNGNVECGDLAAIGFANVTDAGEEGLERLGSAVCGTVVDDDDFHLIGGKILIQDALDGLGDEALVIVSVDKDGDEGRHGLNGLENAASENGQNPRKSGNFRD